VSIDQKDIQLTYLGRPVQKGSILERDAAISLLEAKLAADREQAVVKEYHGNIDGCMDFDPRTVPDPEHPVLKMSDFQQVADIEIGGDKPFAVENWVSKHSNDVHRIERNYELPDGTRIRIGDYLVKCRLVGSNEEVWAYHEKEHFEKNFRRVDIPESAAPNDVIQKLEGENIRLHAALEIIADAYKRVGNVLR